MLILITVTMVVRTMSLHYLVHHRKQTVDLLAQLMEVDSIGCIPAVTISSTICSAVEMRNKIFPWGVNGFASASQKCS